MITDILQPTHLLFVLVVALLVLGPKRLPEAGRALGKGLRDFRSAISGEEDHHDGNSHGVMPAPMPQQETAFTPDVTAPPAETFTPPADTYAPPAEASAPPIETSEAPAEAGREPVDESTEQHTAHSVG